jgi:hypothetical protein
MVVLSPPHSRALVMERPLRSCWSYPCGAERARGGECRTRHWSQLSRMTTFYAPEPELLLDYPGKKAVFDARTTARSEHGSLDEPRCNSSCLLLRRLDTVTRSAPAGITA